MTLTRGILPLILLAGFWQHEAARAAAPPIPDKNLEAAIRAVLHEPKAELTDEKLSNVYVLEAPGKSIRDLTGLEKCKNLALLKLSNNPISDIRALHGLSSLQSLDLSENKISDISPLATLPRLYYLELSKNQVADVSPLGKVTSLSSLYLGNNKIGNIGPLGTLTNLSSLSLEHNQVRNVGSLAKVTRLMTLNLNDNNIVDLAPLTKQKEISLLMLERNKITDLSPLVDMARADTEGAKRFAPYLRLYLAGNPLSEAARSSQVAALKKYGVRVQNRSIRAGSVSDGLDRRLRFRLVYRANSPSDSRYDGAAKGAHEPAQRDANQSAKPSAQQGGAESAAHGCQEATHQPPASDAGVGGQALRLNQQPASAGSKRSTDRARHDHDHAGDECDGVRLKPRPAARPGNQRVDEEREDQGGKDRPERAAQGDDQRRPDLAAGHDGTAIFLGLHGQHLRRRGRRRGRGWMPSQNQRPGINRPAGVLFGQSGFPGKLLHEPSGQRHVRLIFGFHEPRHGPLPQGFG
jgi:hypothetical protein